MVLDSQLQPQGSASRSREAAAQPHNGERQPMPEGKAFRPCISLIRRTATYDHRRSHIYHFKLTSMVGPLWPCKNMGLLPLKRVDRRPKLTAPTEGHQIMLVKVA